MSRPSKEAWKAALHMVAGIYKHKNRGIMFTSGVQDNPVIVSDASNKPDQQDGLVRYGYFAMMAGGPVAFASKKLAHVGLSAFHNE